MSGRPAEYIVVTPRALNPKPGLKGAFYADQYPLARCPHPDRHLRDLRGPLSRPFLCPVPVPPKGAGGQRGGQRRLYPVLPLRRPHCRKNHEDPPFPVGPSHRAPLLSLSVLHVHGPKRRHDGGAHPPPLRTGHVRSQRNGRRNDQSARNRFPSALFPPRFSVRGHLFPGQTSCPVFYLFPNFASR